MGALLEERTAELVQTQANGKQLPRSPALSLALYCFNPRSHTLPGVCWRCLFWLPAHTPPSACADRRGLVLDRHLLTAVLLPAKGQEFLPNSFWRNTVHLLFIPDPRGSSQLSAWGKLFLYGQSAKRVDR